MHLVFVWVVRYTPVSFDYIISNQMDTSIFKGFFFAARRRRRLPSSPHHRWVCALSSLHFNFFLVWRILFVYDFYVVLFAACRCCRCQCCSMLFDIHTKALCLILGCCWFYIWSKTMYQWAHIYKYKLVKKQLGRTDTEYRQNRRGKNHRFNNRRNKEKQQCQKKKKVRKKEKKNETNQETNITTVNLWEIEMVLLCYFEKECCVCLCAQGTKAATYIT